MVYPTNRIASVATLALGHGGYNSIALVIDGFPYLNESSHLEQVKRYIQRLTLPPKQEKGDNRR